MCGRNSDRGEGGGLADSDRPGQGGGRGVKNVQNSRTSFLNRPLPSSSVSVRIEGPSLMSDHLSPSSLRCQMTLSILFFLCDLVRQVMVTTSPVYALSLLADTARWCCSEMEIGDERTSTCLQFVWSIFYV